MCIFQILVRSLSNDFEHREHCRKQARPVLLKVGPDRCSTFEVVREFRHCNAYMPADVRVEPVPCTLSGRVCCEVRRGAARCYRPFECFFLLFQQSEKRVFFAFQRFRMTAHRRVCMCLVSTCICGKCTFVLRAVFIHSNHVCRCHDADIVREKLKYAGKIERERRRISRRVKVSGVRVRGYYVCAPARAFFQIFESIYGPVSVT